MPTILLSTRRKRRINLNDLARHISRREGGLVECNIAQIMEVQKHLLDILGQEWRCNPRGVASLLKGR